MTLETLTQISSQKTCKRLKNVVYLQREYMSIKDRELCQGRIQECQLRRIRRQR